MKLRVIGLRELLRSMGVLLKCSTAEGIDHAKLRKLEA